MKLIGAAFAIAAISAAGAAAQSQTTHHEGTQKIEIKDGKKITVTGCLERNPGGGYMVMTENGDNMKYALITDKDLSKHVGQLVAVRGKAADRGDARVKIESKVGTTGSTDEAKTELKGDLDLPYLGVDSVKTVAKSCR